MKIFILVLGLAQSFVCLSQVKDTHSASGTDTLALVQAFARKTNLSDAKSRALMRILYVHQQSMRPLLQDKTISDEERFKEIRRLDGIKEAAISNLLTKEELQRFKESRKRTPDPALRKKIEERRQKLKRNPKEKNGA